MKVLFFTLILSVTVIQTVPAMEESSESKGYGYGYITLPELSKELAKDSGEKEADDENSYSSLGDVLANMSSPATAPEPVVTEQEAMIFPPEILDQIVLHLSQGRKAEDLIEFLVESRIANMEMFQGPVSIDLSGYGNVITDNIVENIIALFPSIHFLNLNGCSEITDAGIAPLQHQTYLRELDLGNTGITDQGLSYLQNLPNLNSLNLGYNKITDAGLAFLQNLPKLEYLDLSKAQVTDNGMQYIARMKKLHWLNLEKVFTVSTMAMNYLKALNHNLTIY